MNQSDPPLIVDLDGTLIKSDLLLESIYAIIRRNPLLVFFLPLWLLSGKVYFKNRLAQMVQIDSKTLPYNTDFLTYLNNEFSRGRKLVIATASVTKFAEEVASHLGIFTEVFSTDEKYNLSGKRKLALLLENYGEKGFDYAGNSKQDLFIYPHARKAILVNSSKKIYNAARKTSEVQQVFGSYRRNLLFYFNAIRFYQWVKNILLFIPLITSHEFNNVSIVINLFLGFISFSLCASGGYLFNDFLDLLTDRSHPRKKNRPFASGNLSILTGSILMVLLQCTGLGLAALQGWQFFCLLVFYCTISVAYTCHLKKYILIDVLVLAGLYTLRIVAGAVLTNVPLSFWLLAYSIFLFFSLALVKRCSELITVVNTNRDHVKRRAYSIVDIDYLREMGISSGYIAILIFALYINSPDVAILYSHQKLLWMICPFFFYWISRLWFKTARGEMTDDPIVFSIKDKASRYVAYTIIIIILLAI